MIALLGVTLRNRGDFEEQAFCFVIGSWNLSRRNVLINAMYPTSLSSITSRGDEKTTKDHLKLYLQTFFDSKIIIIFGYIEKKTKTKINHQRRKNETGQK